jgi:5-methylcytosine-specific restriction endonuclease McrA
MGTYLKKIRGEKCEECKIIEWNGKPITFQIDHVNGIRKDNRFENLKILCPNCHSQSETWGIKNISENGKFRLIVGAKKGQINRNK